MNEAVKYTTRIPGYEHYHQDEFQELFDKWIDKRRSTTKASSITAYTVLMNNVITFHKGRALSTINKEWALKLIHYLLHERELNPNVARRTLRFVKYILQFAEDEGMIPGMPFPWRQLPKIPKAKINKHPFTYEQYQAVRAELSKDKYCTFWPDTIAIGWHTGLRMSDVVNVRRSRIDLQAGILRSATMKKSAERELLEIPIEPDLRPILERLLSTPPGHDPDILQPHLHFIFTNERCEKMDMQFRRACDACGLPSHSFHSLRHSMVSRLLNAGVDSLIVSQITGHSIAQLAEYAHVTMDAKFAALARSRGGQNVKVIEL
jgi:integrase